jgi:hypothetical protein
MDLKEGLLDGDVFLFHLEQDEDLSLLWDDGQIVAKNRDGYLNFKDDVNGFYRKMFQDKRFTELFETYPEIECYGIWDGEKFIVTDMIHHDKETSKKTSQHFEYYHHFLAHFDINYRMPLIKLISPTREHLEYALMWRTGTWYVKNYSKQVFQLVQVNK